MADEGVFEAVKNALAKAIQPEAFVPSHMDAKIEDLRGNSTPSVIRDIEQALGIKVDVDAVSTSMTGTELATAVAKMKSQ